MNQIKRLALALSLLPGACALAQAEPYDSSWYLMPGISLFEPDSELSAADEGEGAAVRMGTALSQRWDIQFGPSFARAKDQGVQYEQVTLGADMLFMFSRARFRPFLLVGAGAQRDDVWGRGLNMDKTSPYISGGVGFQYGFTDRWSTQVDVRRVHGFLRDDAFPSSSNDNNYLTVGLSYALGAPPRPVAAVEHLSVTETATAPAPAPARVEHYTLSATELFAFDSSQLAPSQAKLDEIATALGDNPGIDNVVVTGFTDRLGSEAYNMALSRRRAEAVKDYLVSRGVAAGRIAAQGKGEATPVIQCTESDRAALIVCLEPNRRVEVDRITIERRAN